jgi:hypothetical protein
MTEGRSSKPVPHFPHSEWGDFGALGRGGPAGRPEAPQSFPGPSHLLVFRREVGVAGGRTADLGVH